MLMAFDWGSLTGGVIGGMLGGGLTVLAGVIAYVGAIRAANRQVAVIEKQQAEADRRRRRVIEWTVKAEGSRLEMAADFIERLLPYFPKNDETKASREQLTIESSPLLRGERQDMALLDDRTQAVLEEVATILAEYNLRVQTTLGDPEPELRAQVERLGRRAVALRDAPADARILRG
jgi:hypothetical protein